MPDSDRLRQTRTRAGVYGLQHGDLLQVTKRLEELIVRHAAGLQIPTLERERRAAGVMMLPIAQRGTLRAVRGQDEAQRVPGIEGLVITVAPGSELVPLPEGDRYLGFMFARAETPEAVERALREAYAKLETVLERPGATPLAQ